jgi:hypothetical protein
MIDIILGVGVWVVGVATGIYFTVQLYDPPKRK